MMTVIWSPGFSVFGFQPCLTKLDGEFISMLHSTALPEAPVTIICIQEWGLIHWNSFTTPDNVIVLDMSKAENAWCPNMGVRHNKIASPASPINRMRLFIFKLPTSCHE
jgi:hypothetical protein